MGLELVGGWMTCPSDFWTLSPSRSHDGVIVMLKLEFTEIEENTWAKLRESRARDRARVTQPTPCIFLHICMN